MQIRKRLMDENKIIPAYDRYEIINCIRECQELKYKALISFLYLTGCRIGEVVKFKVKSELIGFPIMKKQVEKYKDDEYRIYNVRVLKQKKKKKRTIPIILKERERFFWDVFESYLNSITDPDTKLWDYTRQWVHHVLQRVGLFPHLLRHSRVTHLVRDYNYDVTQLKKFIGWSRADTADVYTHLRVDDLSEMMRKG